MTVQAEIQTAADEAAEEAAFAAGFDGTDIVGEGEAYQAQDDTTSTATEVEDHAEATDAEVAAEVATPAADTLTMAQVQELLAAQKAELEGTITKTQDRLFGKLGEFNQKIEAARTAAVGLSPKARERLEDAFPELAEMLFEGAGEVPAAAQVVAPTTPEQPVVPAIDPDALKEDLRKERAFERVLDVHEDYHDIVASEAFATWKDTVLDPELSAQLDESWDPRFINKRFNEFKGWRAAQAIRKNKQEALDAAVVPRGLPRAGGSSGDDDDEEAAMLKAYGRK